MKRGPRLAEVLGTAFCMALAFAVAAGWVL